VVHLEQVLVSISFVYLGGEIDLRAFDLSEAYKRQVLLAAVLLTCAAILGKYLAGYALLGRRRNRKVVGMGMIPHGEMGLVFGHMGLVSGVFDQVMFSAIGFAVVVTTVVGLLGLQSLWPMIPATAETQNATPGPSSAAEAALSTTPS
jgi:Kef-type K+ transport system membrane component KefB